MGLVSFAGCAKCVVDWLHGGNESWIRIFQGKVIGVYLT